MQRGPSLLLFGIGRSAMFEQQPSCVFFCEKAGEVQRREPIGGPGVHQSGVVADEFGYSTDVAQARRFEYIEITPCGQQQVEDIFALAIESVHDGGDSSGISGGGIGCILSQQFAIFHDVSGLDCIDDSLSGVHTFCPYISNLVSDATELYWV